MQHFYDQNINPSNFSNNLAERHKFILNCIDENLFEHYWVPITINEQNNELIIYVSSDALKIAGIRVNVSACVQQQIADKLEASLVTTKIADLIYQNSAIKIRPFTQEINSSVSGMIKHSNDIDKYVLDFCNTNNIVYSPEYQIISNVGKYWVLDNMISKIKAVNYGWFVNANPWRSIKTYKTASTFGDGALYTIQPKANAHDPHHSDYSQTCVLVKNACLLNGNEMTIQEILQDKNLFSLLSYYPLQIQVLKQLWQ